MLRIHLTLVAALGAFFAPAYGLTHFIPSTIQNGTSNAQFVSTSSPLDAPKVSPINGSAYDWWYFDAVSTDPSSRASVVVIFFTSSQPAFPLLSPSPVITVARIWVSFPNGTLWSAEADAASATVVVPDTTGGKQRTSGVWNGTGLSWSGTPAGGYVVLVDAPGIGVQGKISFEPTAPPHYPCGPAAASSAGQTLLVGPNIGWANAVPDAKASCWRMAARGRRTWQPSKAQTRHVRVSGREGVALTRHDATRRVSTRYHNTANSTTIVRLCEPVYVATIVL